MTSDALRNFLVWIWPTVQRLYLRAGILVTMPAQRMVIDPLPIGPTKVPVDPATAQQIHPREHLERQVKADLEKRRQDHVGGAHAQHHDQKKVPGGHSHIWILVLLIASAAHAQTISDTDYVKAVHRRDELKDKFNRDQASYIKKHQKEIDEYQGLVARTQQYLAQHAPQPPAAPAPKEEAKPETK